MCSCCSCYPYEEEDEVITGQIGENWRTHPYLSTAITQQRPSFLRGRNSNEGETTTYSQQSSIPENSA